MLSGKQLIDLADKAHTKLIVTGTKSVHVEGSPQNQQVFTKIKENYKEVCCKERIARSETRMTGNYHPETQKVTIKALTGTSHRYFGQTDRHGTHLRLYEALYLIEIDDLLVYYDSVIISIEQAYALFLGSSDAELTFEQYMAYKNLLQSGFVVLKHKEMPLDDPESDISEEIETPKDPKPANIDIWDCLRSKLHFLNWKEITNKRIDEEISDKFKETCAKFQGQQAFLSHSPPEIDGPPQKKSKLEDLSPTKRINMTKSILNTNETHEFDHIFSQLDIIGTDFDEFPSNEHFDFDIFYAEEAKKLKLSQCNPCLPNFYGKVVKFDSQIDYSVIHALKSQAKQIPVMLLIVFDNLSISSFIC